MAGFRENEIAVEQLTHRRESRAKDSSAGAECVSAPMEMKSTPAPAAARMFASVMPPLASSCTPAGRSRTASRISSGDMLSKKDHVDARHPVKLAHLLERVGLEPPRAGRRPSRSALPSASDAASSPAREVIVLHPSPCRAGRGGDSCRRRPSPRPSRDRGSPASSCACRASARPCPRWPRRSAAPAWPRRKAVAKKLRAVRSAVRIEPVGPATRSTSSPGASAAPSCATISTRSR